MDVPCSLYVHIPFCRQRCHYCHFDIKVFHPSNKKRDSTIQSYIDSLIVELAFYAQTMGRRRLLSVYFGGGTPSYLSDGQLGQLVEAIRSYFPVEETAEWTLEMNPEDVQPGCASRLRELGFTRVSLGVQSFETKVLQAVKRNHSPEQAIAALRELKGFRHGVSMDLILGLPHQNLDLVRRDLQKWAEFSTEHLSLYLLERDIPTSLDRYKGPIPSEDDQARFYEETCEFLGRKGFNHYEISNFSKPGFESAHNLNYWRCGDYLGIGSAAHGRVGIDYWMNEPRVSDYVKNVEDNGNGVARKETWSSSTLANQELMQGMRLKEGIADSQLFPSQREALQERETLGLVSQVQGRWALTRRGRLLANEVFEVFLDEF